MSLSVYEFECVCVHVCSAYGCMCVHVSVSV